MMQISVITLLEKDWITKNSKQTLSETHLWNDVFIELKRFGALVCVKIVSTQYVDENPLEHSNCSKFCLFYKMTCAAHSLFTKD